MTTITQILAAMELQTESDNVIRMGMSLAQKFDALLVCVFVIAPSDGPRYAGGLTLDAVMQAKAEQDEAKARRRQTKFDVAAHRLGIRAEWHTLRGFPDEEIVRQTRYCDLAIIEQFDPVPQRSDFRLRPDKILIAAESPIIVVPRENEFADSVRRVLVAWNGSKEATRAVHDALPLLKSVDAVDVVLVNEHKGGRDLWSDHEESAVGISTLLARHGIHPDLHLESPTHKHVGEQLLGLARQFGAELIVAGAFSHSRAREFVLGGVTRHLLHNATIPVLFSR